MENYQSNDTVEKWQKTFSLLLNNRKDLLCVADKQGYFTEVNSAWEDFLGFDLHTFTSRPLLEFVHPDDVERTRSELRSLTDEKAPTLVFVNRYRTVWGDYKYLSWSAFPFGDKVYCVARDITEIKQIQKDLEDKNSQLRINEAKLKKITDALPGFVFQLNHKGEVAFYNSVSRSLFFQQDPTGAHYLNVFSKDMISIIQLCLNQFDHNNERQEYEVATQHQEQRRIFHGVAELFYGEKNELKGYIFTGWDITKQRQQEEEKFHLISEAKAAQEASRLKSEFLAYMSHELRTPLVGIVGISELLFGTLNLNEEQQHFFEKIQHCTQQLLSIINDVLDLSKIEANKMDFSNEAFDLFQCIHHNMDIYSTKAAEKNIELMYYTCPLLPTWILGDKTRLSQVICNILSNALKFTQEGSVILKCDYEIVTKDNPQTESGSLQKWPENCPVKILFTIEDTGIGISEASKKRLFEPFTQADSSTTRVFGGTGLGLAICRKFLHLMNGDIACESQFGKGSIFKFFFYTLTASIKKKPTTVHDAPKVIEHLKNKHVLILDSSHLTSQVFVDYFRKWSSLPRWEPYDDPQLPQLAAEAYIIVLVVHEVVSVKNKWVQNLNSYQQRLILCSNISFHSTDPLGMMPVRIRLKFTMQELMFAIKKVTPWTESTAEQQKAIVPRTCLTGIEDIKKLVRESPRPIQVLIVDDNSINRDVLCAILKRMNLGFHIATNGQEAVDLVTKSIEGEGPWECSSYSMILMDCHMPVLDGYEATEIIRKWEKERGLHIPIVALTASAMKEDEQRCKAAGMDDFMTKPYALGGLCSLLYRWLNPFP